jgi:biopolymer transport protein ExbD
MNLRPSAERRTEPNLELTPLIDIVFLLLIFFLITTSFARNEESSVPIELAEASSGASSSEGQSFVLSVTSKGDVVVDDRGDPVSGESLRRRLEALHDENPDARVLLRGDRETSHGRILEILDVAKEVGFTSVDMVVRRPPKQKNPGSPKAPGE